MNVITIPKQITKGDELIVNVKVKRSLKVAKKYEKFYDELDKELSASIKDYERGNYNGPFNSADEFRKSLEKCSSICS